MTDNEKLELLRKVGECKCTVGGQSLYISFEENKINNKVLPAEDFEKFIMNNAEEVTNTAEIIKWITSEEYCRIHNINRSLLNYRVKTGKVLVKVLNKRISLYEK